MNRRGPGLLGAVARTAVVAGTASAVSGRVQQRQQQRWGAQEAAAQEEAAAQQQAVQQQTPLPRRRLPRPRRTTSSTGWNDWPS